MRPSFHILPVRPQTHVPAQKVALVHVVFKTSLADAGHEQKQNIFIFQVASRKSIIQWIGFWESLLLKPWDSWIREGPATFLPNKLEQLINAGWGLDSV